MPPENFRASQTSTAYSAGSDIFCPKPPPTSGAMTRKSDSGKPSTSATAVRSRCGICVAQVSVMRPVAGSNAACAPRASSGVAFCRRERSAMSIRRCAPAIAAAKSGVAKRLSTTTLFVSPSCTGGASGCNASWASITAGSASISTLTASARSSASAGEGAITAAIGSPTKRTTPEASSGCSIGR